MAPGAARRRALIEESITPVWEANHVWLVFDLVIFWTAFPAAFAAVMTACALPLWLAVAGTVLRGAGFAFRKELSRLPSLRAADATFAFSSLLSRPSSGQSDAHPSRNGAMPRTVTTGN